MMNNVLTHSKTTPLHTISALDVVRRRDCLLVDIRQFQERELMGYIPISVAVPSEPSWFEGLAALHHLLAQTSCLVLVCQRGQRAARLQEKFSSLWNLPVLALEGGMRAWEEFGLPMVSPARVRETHFRLQSPEEAYRNLLSCFSAEWIESSLNEDRDPENPRPVLDACFEAVGCVPAQTPWERWPQILSHASVCSWRVGTSLARIRDNLDDFHAALEYAQMTR